MATGSRWSGFDGHRRRRWSSLGSTLVLGIGAIAGTLSLTLSATPAAAQGATYYASVGGSGTTCTSSTPCSLTEALTVVTAGDTIELTTAGTEGSTPTYYSGGFVVDTTGTSSSAPVTIEAEPGLSSAPILDGTGGTSPVLRIATGAYVDVGGLTIQNGDGGSGGGGGIRNEQSGSVLKVTDCTFYDDTATSNGGAIDNGPSSGSSTATVTDSTFDGNSANSGGAIYNGASEATATFTITDSTFYDNSAGSYGGAIDNSDDFTTGNLTVTASTFSDNTSPLNGATIANSYGGEGTLTAAGDVFAGSCRFGGSTHWVDDGYNVGEDTTCMNGGTGDTDSTGSNLASELGSLAANGGPTQTMELLSGNPAISLIPASGTSLCPVASDQRGDASTSGATCDAGAVQYATQSISFTSTAPNPGVPTSTYRPTATATSELAVSFSIASGSSSVCSISAGLVTFNEPGTCVIDANQGGNADWSPAEVTQSVTVSLLELFAAPSVQGTGSCTSAANPCTLTTALADVGDGGTIYLTQAGAEGTTSTYYSGGFSVDTSGTSASQPITIEAEPGLSSAPILDGGASANVIFMANSAYLDLIGLTIQRGSGDLGGGIVNNRGGTLDVTNCTFLNNSGIDGGAIDNADNDGSGTLTVSDSTFSGNTASKAPNGNLGDGGAIDNANQGGTGTATILDSTFSGNSAQADGGAIDNGDSSGTTGSLTVTASTFSGNTASTHGSAVDSGDNSGGGSTTVAADIFTSPCYQGAGTWTDDGYNVGANTTCFASTPATGDTDSAGSNLASELGSLASNGGSTQTMELLSSNPAISRIPASGTSLCPVTSDQRGDASGSGAACDAGAVQYATQSVAITSSPPMSPQVGQNYTVSATATSGLSPALTIDSGTSARCSISGNVVTLTGSGYCQVDANQSGNANWSAASQASQAFVVYGSILYAAPSVQGTGSCNLVSNACTLSTALANAAPGATIELTQAGTEGTSSSYYSGGFDVDTAGTSAADPVSIEPESGLSSAPILDGGDSSTVLSITDAAFVDVSGVTIQDGSSTYGGGIANVHGGTLDVSATTFSDNTATHGAGIDNGDGSTLSVTDSTFGTNTTTSGGNGGAIDNADETTGAATVTDSTFYDDTAPDGTGGAIDSGYGGTSGTFTLTQSTLDDNSALGGSGQAVYSNAAFTDGADVVTSNCDQAMPFTDKGYNVGTNSSCWNSSTGDTASTGSNLPSELGSLASNGGSTQTMELLSGNPAISLIPASGTSFCPVTSDQRGDASGSGAPCDAGAVQYAQQSVSFATSAPDPGQVGGTYTPAATSTSRLGVTLSIDPSSTSVCSIASGVVTFNAVGTCLVDANQGGNSDWTAASQVTQMVTVDQAPAITSDASTTFTVGSQGSFQMSATGTPAPTFSETGSLPGGVTLSSAGLLSGTPAPGTGGTYDLSVTASNNVGTNATQSFVLTVDQAPAITSDASTTFTVGSQGSFQMSATGTPAPTFSETGSLPGGVTLSSAGLLSGTPAPGTGGTYDLSVTASNNVGTNATQSFVLTVDQAPAITSDASTTFTVGSQGSFQMSATGTPAPTFSETGSLPGGVTLSSAGLLSGTPAPGTGGTYDLSVTASNNVGTNATQSFVLTVDQAPAITSDASTTFTVGSQGSFQMSATGTPAPTFSETGSLPGGVTLSSAGLLSGTPAPGTGGTYDLSVTASNNVGTNATQSFVLTVDQAPAITSDASTTFTVGSQGSFQMSATGTPAPTFSETGSLPGGVTLSSAGLLSGTPAPGTGGTYDLSVTASNNVGTNATQSFVLTVDQAPAITSDASTTFTVGSQGSFQMSATGTPAPTFSETGSLPGGVTLSSAGLLSGTPAPGTGGTYDLSVTASNNVGTNATQSFVLTVDQAPAITSDASTTFTVGSQGSFQMSATGTPAPTFSETGSLPGGVTLSSAGLLSGTPAPGTGGTYDLSVTASNNVGTNATQSFVLSVASGTTVTKVTPSSGSGDGGTKVTVDGTDLGGATSVMFGASPATDVVVSSKGTSLTAFSPSGNGTVDVTVTTSNGTSLPNPPYDQYSYLAPTVTKVVPTSGPGNGGNKVTIEGKDLQGASSIMFGPDAASNFTVNAAGTAIIAYAPTEAAGTVDITVTTPGGTSTTSSADQYSYLAPTVTKVVPTSGPGNGGNKVTIEGKDLQGASSIMFGPDAASNFTVNAAGTAIIAYAPTEAAGTVDITVTTPGGTSTTSSADQYSYLAPTVTKVVPTSGPGNGGNKVTIEGKDLQGASSIMFGPDAASNFTVNAAGTAIIAYAPTEAAGTVDITVTTPGGTSTTSSADQYSYLAPTVTKVIPTSGPGNGGNKVTIEGKDLQGASSIMFGPDAASNFTVNAAGTAIIAYAPTEAAGTVDITVTTPGGTSTTNPPYDQYSYLAPTVTKVVPTSGSVNGANTVTIEGKDLQGASSVMFGDVSATDVVVSSTGTSLTATAPAESAGTVDVTVTTPGGTSASSTADHYTYAETG